MTAVHVLLSGAHITLHLATLGSWAKSNGVSFQFSPVIVNFWVFTLWPPTMLSIIVSSEVPYLSGHLRAFAAIWLLGTIICLQLLLVLIEIALGFCLNQLWWHITAWKKCWALSPFTSRAGGIKKAGNWCFSLINLWYLDGTGHCLTRGHLTNANTFAMWRSFAGAMCICLGRCNVLFLSYLSVNLTAPMHIMVGAAWYWGRGFSGRFANFLSDWFGPGMIRAGCGNHVGHCDIVVGHCDIAGSCVIVIVIIKVGHEDVLGVGCAIIPDIWHCVLGIGTRQALSRRGYILI